MAGVHNGLAGPDTCREEPAWSRCSALPSGGPSRTLRDSPPSDAGAGERSTRPGTAPHGANPEEAGDGGLAGLHESISDMLASRGQWEQAYRHLRLAMDLRRNAECPRVPEQLRHEVDRLRREHAQAREQSLRDTLTDSYNRRYLEERLGDLISGDVRGIGLALIDLDWFKQVNDTFGHVLGDRVLQRVVELVQKALPTGGFCARYGGEEFVLVLPSVDPATAVAICDEARRRVEFFPWQRMAPELRVTVSIGLGYDTHGWESGSTAIAIEQKILSADALLYAAKHAGRNTVAHRTAGEVRLTGGTRVPDPVGNGY